VVPDVRFKSRSITLPAQALMTAFSDGIVEARDACGHAFDFERLRQSMRQAAKANGSAIEKLRNDVVDFVGRAKQHDDATLLCLRRG
jgi:serine phosphatase RsbU (regulator of sigma subunit)